MNKYIIRNCPAILRMTKVCDDYRTTRDNPQLCKDCTDCVMKQIVEKCKHIKSINKTNSYVGEYIEFTQKSPLAEEILDLLNIQEVE